ncbi:MAG TPA: LamG domain-containing protein [Anaerolineales bacterium]|nr:LamG domain-containing protein [Anaerolineales bacterium]
MKFDISKGSARIVVVILLSAMLLGAVPEKPSWAYGGSYALRFDGVSDYVSIGNLVTSTTDVLGAGWQSTKSISMWIKPTGAAPEASSIGSLGQIFCDNPRWFGLARGIFSGQDRIWVWNADGTIDWVGIEYTQDEWVHITVVHANGLLKIYKNGVLAGVTTSGATQQPGAAQTYLSFGGAFIGNPAPKFRGEIDELAFWATELTEYQIRDMMYREVDSGAANLRAYYAMSDGSGTFVNDDGPNSFTGTYNGTPKWISSGALAGPRNALDFDGTDNYVNVPASFALPGNLTFETWIYPRDMTTGVKWIMGEAGGARLVSDGAGLKFYIYDGSSLQGPATASIVGEKWQHVAATFDGSTMKLYVDGLPGTDYSYSGSNVDAGGAFTLASPDGSIQMNDIILDEVRVWNYARSPGALFEGIFQTLKGSELGLTAYYRMDLGKAGSSNLGLVTLYDITDNDYDGLLVGFSLSGPKSNWVSSSAFNTWVGSDSSDWSASNNWSRYAAPVASDHVGIYNYPASNAVSIGSGVIASASSLRIAPGADLNVAAGGSLSVTGLMDNLGSLSNSGTIQHTQNVSGPAAVQFVGGGNYGGLLLNPNGDNLGSTTVTIKGNQDCTTVSGETVLRCFNVAPSNPAVTGATITFYFDESEVAFPNTCNTLNAYHWNSLTSTWDELNMISRDCSSAPRLISVSGVTGFSPFTLKSSTNPTAVSLVSFSGRSSSGWGAPGLLLLLLAGLALFTLRTVFQTMAG